MLTRITGARRLSTSVVVVCFLSSCACALLPLGAALPVATTTCTELCAPHASSSPNDDCIARCEIFVWTSDGRWTPAGRFSWRPHHPSPTPPRVNNNHNNDDVADAGLSSVATRPMTSYKRAPSSFVRLGRQSRTYFGKRVAHPGSTRSSWPRLIDYGRLLKTRPLVQHRPEVVPGAEFKLNNNELKKRYSSFVRIGRGARPTGSRPTDDVINRSAKRYSSFVRIGRRSGASVARPAAAAAGQTTSWTRLRPSSVFRPLSPPGDVKATFPGNVVDGSGWWPTSEVDRGIPTSLVDNFDRLPSSGSDDETRRSATDLNGFGGADITKDDVQFVPSTIDGEVDPSELPSNVVLEAPWTKDVDGESADQNVADDFNDGQDVKRVSSFVRIG